MKTLISKTIIMLIAVVLAASCSKQDTPKAAPKPSQKSTKKAVPKTADASAPAPIHIPDIMNRKSESVNPAEVFTVRRNGQDVTLQLLLDFSGCKSIEIQRNTTGISKNKDLVGKLKPGTRQFVDTVPDARAYWYWVRVYPPKGPAKNFGPLRDTPGAESKSDYKPAQSSYTWTLSRTNTTATITWNFPNQKYQLITIYRNTKADPRTQKTVFETREWSGHTQDQLPDADADYWYWISALLENGSVITQGPAKAAFVAH